MGASNSEVSTAMEPALRWVLTSVASMMAKAAETIKRLLSNLATITQGIAELRNKYGTGHGKVAKTKGLSPRHAKLAVGAASSGIPPTQLIGP